MKWQGVLVLGLLKRAVPILVAAAIGALTVAGFLPDGVQQCVEAAIQ